MSTEIQLRENLKKCPVCFSDDINFDFSKKDKNLKTPDNFYICRNCGIFFIQNRLPLEFLNDKFYSRRKEVSFDHLLLRKKHLKRIADEVMAFFQVSKNYKIKILDIGCGWGLLLRYFKERGCLVYGVDVSESACRQTRELLGIDTVFCGEVTGLDLKREYFDAITLTDVLEHLYNPNFYFEKIYELLKPGGIFAIRTPNEGSLMRRVFASKWHLFSPRHISLYNKKSLKKILKVHYFGILKIKAERESFKNLLPPFYIWRNYSAVSFYSRIRYFAINWILNILRFSAGIFGMGDSILALARKNESR